MLKWFHFKKNRPRGKGGPMVREYEDIAAAASRSYVCVYIFSGLANTRCFTHLANIPYLANIPNLANILYLANIPYMAQFNQHDQYLCPAHFSQHSVLCPYVCDLCHIRLLYMAINRRGGGDWDIWQVIHPICQ